MLHLGRLAGKLVVGRVHLLLLVGYLGLLYVDLIVKGAYLCVFRAQLCSQLRILLAFAGRLQGCRSNQLVLLLYLVLERLYLLVRGLQLGVLSRRVTAGLEELVLGGSSLGLDLRQLLIFLVEAG